MPGAGKTAVAITRQRSIPVPPPFEVLADTKQKLLLPRVDPALPAGERFYHSDHCLERRRMLGRIDCIARLQVFPASVNRQERFDILTALKRAGGRLNWDVLIQDNPQVTHDK